MRKLVFPVIVLLAAAGAGLAYAKSPSLIAEQGAWRAYSFEDKGEKVCFMSAVPQRKAGKVKKRGDVAFFITRWPGEQEKNVVSVSGGYTFKPDSAVTVKVDGQTFSLFTQGEMAWTRDHATDEVIAKALRKGSTLSVKGMSQDGTETNDTYSLSGSGAIYDAMEKECAKRDKPPVAAPAKPQAPEKPKAPQKPTTNQ